MEYKVPTQGTSPTLQHDQPLKFQHLQGAGIGGLQNLYSPVQIRVSPPQQSLEILTVSRLFVLYTIFRKSGLVLLCKKGGSVKNIGVRGNPRKARTLFS